MQHWVGKRIKVENRLGLHARAAARIVKVAAAFKETEIKIANAEQPQEEVNALSVLGLMMLQALKGSSLQIRARGAQAEQATAAIAELVKQKFNED